jgi:hypothetical protein
VDRLRLKTQLWQSRCGLDPAAEWRCKSLGYGDLNVQSSSLYHILPPFWFAERWDQYLKGSVFGMRDDFGYFHKSPLDFLPKFHSTNHLHLIARLFSVFSTPRILSITILVSGVNHPWADSGHAMRGGPSDNFLHHVWRMTSGHLICGSGRSGTETSGIWRDVEFWTVIMSSDKSSEIMNEDQITSIETPWAPITSHVRVWPNMTALLVFFGLEKLSYFRFNFALFIRWMDDMNRRYEYCFIILGRVFSFLSGKHSVCNAINELSHFHWYEFIKLRLQRSGLSTSSVGPIGWVQIWPETLLETESITSVIFIIIRASTNCILLSP